MTREDLAQEWRERLDDFAQSNSTVVDWCYFNHVSVHQYYYWRRRLADNLPQATQKQGFLPVEVVETAPLPAVTTGVTVRIAGAAIELAPGFDPATLCAVVAALATLSC
jgi:hypothetical protein